MNTTCRHSRQRGFLAAISVAIPAMVIGSGLSVPATASVTTFTSSTAFNAATSGLTAETYATGTNGQTIANGGQFDTLTYNFSTGTNTFATLLGGMITNQFNSFSGLSLGGQQSTGQHFFFGGNSVTVTFPTPVLDVGVFFNVNQNSGTFTLTASVGSVSTNSATFDTSTFVFDGIVSTTPFTSVTFASTTSTWDRSTFRKSNSDRLPLLPFPSLPPSPCSSPLLLVSGFSVVGHLAEGSIA
jgi:hypothetical protein